MGFQSLGRYNSCGRSPPGLVHFCSGGPLCPPGDRPLLRLEVRGRRAAARASAGRTAQAL